MENLNNNWKTFPLYKPINGKNYITLDLQGKEVKMKFNNNKWYTLDNRIIINPPIKYKDEKE